MSEKTANAEENDAQKYRAPALSKGLDILELLASEVEGMSQAEIAKTLGRTTSEIFRMLMVLRDRGYVEQKDAERYSLTTKMFEVAHRHPPIKRLTSIAGNLMQHLANEINQSIHMGILHSGGVLIISQVDCPDNQTTSVRLGAHIPLFDTASGRVLAAWMDDETLQQLLSAVPDKDPAKHKQFVADLEEVKDEGYSESPSFTIGGVLNISAPIFGFSGDVIAAITIPYVQRLSSPATLSVGKSRQLLIEMCTDLSRQMGAFAA